MKSHVSNEVIYKIVIKVILKQVYAGMLRYLSPEAFLLRLTVEFHNVTFKCYLYM